MNWQALWFVLAGLILGFALSTLWEWLYFRRARLTVNDEHVAELEEQLHIVQQREREDSTGGYLSPGVLLESEEAEDLSDLTTPLVETESHTDAAANALVIHEPEDVPLHDAIGEAVDDGFDDSELTLATESFVGVSSVAATAETEEGRQDTAVATDEDEGPAGADDSMAATDDLPDEDAIVSKTVLAAGAIAGAITAATAADANKESQFTTGTDAAEDETSVADDEASFLPAALDGQDDEVVSFTAEDAADPNLQAVDEEIVGDIEPIQDETMGADDTWLVTGGAIDEAKPEAVADALPADVERPDDLCKIEGIGPARRRAFYNAGIFTWYQLGQLSPEEVRDVINVSAAEEWPARARQLAERYGREGAEYHGPTPDNLTKVRGVGPSTMQLLYRRGIWSFEQLAELSPEELEELLPAGSSTVDERSQWLASAKEIADEAGEG